MSKPKFKIGDRVRTNGMGYGYNPKGTEFKVTGIVTSPSPLFGEYYYTGDQAGGAWEIYLELVESGEEELSETYSAGDLVEARKGETVIRGRLQSSRYDDFLWLYRFGSTERLVKDGFKLTLIEKALKPLPTRHGIYTSAKNTKDDYMLSGTSVARLDDKGWHLEADVADDDDREKVMRLVNHLHNNLGGLVRLVPEVNE